MERMAALAIPLDAAHFALRRCVSIAVRIEQSTVFQRIICLRELLHTRRAVAFGAQCLRRQEDVACRLARLRGCMAVRASHVLVWRMREQASLHPALRDVRW